MTDFFCCWNTFGDNIILREYDILEIVSLAVDVPWYNGNIKGPSFMLYTYCEFSQEECGYCAYDYGKLKTMEIRGTHPNFIQLSSAGCSAVAVVWVIWRSTPVVSCRIITSERLLPVFFFAIFVSKWVWGHLWPSKTPFTNRLCNAIKNHVFSRIVAMLREKKRILGNRRWPQVVPMGYQRPAPRAVLPVGRPNLVQRWGLSLDPHN